MKIAGVELAAPDNVIIPIIRGGTEIIFQAACVVDFSEFENVLKAPEPKIRTKPGDTVGKPIVDSAEFKTAINEYSSSKVAWMVCKSLLATKDLEWETVDFSNPETWINYEAELKGISLNEYQISKLVTGVMEANGLSESRVAEAKARFLASQQEVASE